MAAGFGINRFQLSIKYISWMVGIVPLVSQTATAGGEAGVGVYVAGLGRGEGRCDTAELHWGEALEIQQGPPLCEGREEAREAQQTFTVRPRGLQT